MPSDVPQRNVRRAGGAPRRAGGSVRDRNVELIVQLRFIGFGLSLAAMAVPIVQLLAALPTLRLGD